MEFGVWIRGARLEARRRLRPVTSGIGATWSRVDSALTPIVSRITRLLFYLLLVPVRLIVLLLDLVRWTHARASAAITFLARIVTPVAAVAFVAAAAAIALGVSQFVDYRGVAVGEPQYTGEVGTVARVPLTEVETTGSAHAYAMLPFAALALALIALAAVRDWRYGRALSLVGAVGIAIALLIDLPNGLDAGRAGLAYIGSDAHLLEGFWAQLASCATLVLCGLLLSAYARRAQASRGRQAERVRQEVQRRSARQLDAGGPVHSSVSAGSVGPEPGI